MNEVTKFVLSDDADLADADFEDLADADFEWMQYHHPEVVDAAVSKAIGELMERIRKIRGVSRIAVTTRMSHSIDPSWLSRLEGGRPPRVTLLLDWCITLGVSMPAVLTQSMKQARRELEHGITEENYSVVRSLGMPCGRTNYHRLRPRTRKCATSTREGHLFAKSPIASMLNMERLDPC